MCNVQNLCTAYIHAAIHRLLHGVDKQQIVVAVEVVEFLAAVLLVVVTALAVVRVLSWSHCDARNISGSKV